MGKRQKGRRKEERRYLDYIKAKRKKDISDSWWSAPYYSHFNQYNKGKIHCSCGMCRHKTNNKGKRRYLPKNYAPSYNPKHSDAQRDAKAENQLQDYYESFRYKGG